jgi:hypothetical protein
MNRSSHKLLADAALTLQQHGRMRGRGLPDRFVDLSQGRTVAHHLILRIDFLPQRAIRGLGTIPGELFLDALQENRLGEWLLNEAGRALVACFEGVLRSAVPRHHDDGYCRVGDFDALEHLEAVHAGHFDVEENEIRRVALD